MAVSGDIKIEEYCCPAEFDDDEAMTKLFVNKIPKDQTDEQLKEAFSEWPIKSASIVKKDDKDWLFGFVVFEKCDDLDECILKKTEFMAKTKFEGLKRAVPKDDSRKPNALYRTKKLFVGNVTAEVNEQNIRDYLKKRHGKYVEVEEVHIVKKKDEKGEPTDENKGFGFVTLTTEDMVDRVHNCENSAEIVKGSADDKKQRLQRSQPRGDGSFRGGRGGGQRGGYQQQAGGYGAQDGGYGGYGYGGGFHPGMYYTPYHTDPYMRYGY